MNQKFLDQKETIKRFNKVNQFIPDFEYEFTASIFDTKLTKIIGLIERLKETIIKKDLKDDFWIDYTVDYYDNNILTGKVNVKIIWKMNEIKINNYYELIAQIRQVNNRMVTNLFSTNAKYQDMFDVVYGKNNIDFSEIRCESCHKQISNRNNVFIVKNEKNGEIEYYGSNCIHKIIPEKMIQDLNYLIDSLFKITNQVEKIKEDTDKAPDDILDAVWKKLTIKNGKFSFDNMHNRNDIKSYLKNILLEKYNKKELTKDEMTALNLTINDDNQIDFKPNKEDFISFIRKGRQLGSSRNNARELLKPENKVQFKDLGKNLIKIDIQKNLRKELFNCAAEYYCDAIKDDLYNSFMKKIDYNNLQKEYKEKHEKYKPIYENLLKVNDVVENFSDENMVIYNLGSMIKNNNMLLDVVDGFGNHMLANLKRDFAYLPNNKAYDKFENFKKLYSVKQTNSTINIELKNKNKNEIVINKKFKTKLDNKTLNKISFMAITMVLYNNYLLPLKEIDKNFVDIQALKYNDILLDIEKYQFKNLKTFEYLIKNISFLTSTESKVYLDTIDKTNTDEKYQKIYNEYKDAEDDKEKDKALNTLIDNLEKYNNVDIIKKINMFEVIFNKIECNYDFDIVLKNQNGLFELVGNSETKTYNNDLIINSDLVRDEILKMPTMFDKKYDSFLKTLNIESKKYNSRYNLSKFKVYYFSKNKDLKKPYNFIKLLATPEVTETTFTKDKEDDLLRRTVVLCVNTLTKEFKENGSENRIKDILLNIYPSSLLENKSDEELAEMMLIYGLKQSFNSDNYMKAKIK